MIGIYKITSPTKKVYIGQSININERIKYYKNLNCKPQKALYSSLIKYGFDNHKFEILELCEVEQLNEKERYYQDLYQAVGKNGLNLILTKTNIKPRVYSLETRKKMSISQTGKKALFCTRYKQRLKALGRKQSKETIEKINKNKKIKCASYDEKNNLIKEFSSLVEASLFYKVKYQSILRAIKKKGNCRGCKWRFI